VAKNKKTNKKKEEKKKKTQFSSSIKARGWVWAVIMLTLGLISLLSFFNRAGIAGEFFLKSLGFLIGKVSYLFPVFCILAALIFFKVKTEKILKSVIFGIIISLLGISGIVGALEIDQKNGGYLGYLISLPMLKVFEIWVTEIILLGLTIIGFLFLFQFLLPEKSKEGEEEKSSFIKKIFGPKFRIKEIPAGQTEDYLIASQKGKLISQSEEEKTQSLEMKTKPIDQKLPTYEIPPIDLLEADRGTPSSGDIKTNSAIIKRTLQNFDIPVEMGEINIGPTVTQYTLKPAEGVKLTKITALSNDLSLALASHPIRIETPIPGKSLVGIEIPNKVRTLVRLRGLISHPDFQNSYSSLAFVLGRDVTGLQTLADLSRMPHLLVAGSTGTGKTIFLNSLILSLLYKNSPEILRLILVDPKRVELTLYNELPHLLGPVISDANKTINVLKWLVKEMERRFEVLSEVKVRNITSYNATIKESDNIMPFIVLVIDELADLMAAKGREIEAGIVRLAQMARAVGIHLVVATQRPSVEVITGLIKANITSRITFQVASQVDSRTVLDMAGAEKLLGQGDMLYVSAETIKPKRIQGAYVSDKEVKKVVNWIKLKNKITEDKITDNLSLYIERGPDESEKEFETNYGQEDSFYEEAKRVVIESKKASASLLQRRLRVGYARAARLIDILEERGVIGPGDGAKPREVYIKEEDY